MNRKMKDSGIEWLGEIPEDWEISRIKYVSNNLYTGGTPQSENDNFYDDDGIPFVTISDMSCYDFVEKTNKSITEIGIEDKKLKVLPKGTILYSIYATIGKVSELNINACINQALIAIIPNDILEKKYLKYSLKAMEDYVLSQCFLTSQNNLNSFKVKNFNILILSKEEQKLIVETLNKKCSQIDDLIQNQQQQIEKLKKYKQSLITEVVTKGLEPNVLMKDSGVEWIGQIPENWEVERIKFNLKRNEPKNPGNMEVLSLYREYGVIPKNSRNDNHNVTSEDLSKYKYVKKGNLVINKMKAWQGSLGVSNFEGVVSPAYFVYEFKNNRINKLYFHYLIRSCYKDEFMRLSSGVREGQWDLSSNMFENTLFLIPLINEQEKIATYLDKKCLQIDNLIKIKEEKIQKLNDYKKSIIYEYVTGKKEA